MSFICQKCHQHHGLPFLSGAYKFADKRAARAHAQNCQVLFQMVFLRILSQPQPEPTACEKTPSCAQKWGFRPHCHCCACAVTTYT